LDFNEMNTRIIKTIAYANFMLVSAFFFNSATAQTDMQKQDAISIIKERTARSTAPTPGAELTPIDCMKQPEPRIERMPAEFRPGDTFVIEGHCLKGHQPVRFYFTGAAAIQPYTTTGAATELVAQSNNRRIVLQISKGLPRINSGAIKIEVATPKGTAQGISTFINN
jgi:hypothetical protein